MTAKTVAALLRQDILRRDMSIRKWCKAFGVSPSHVSRVLRGEKEPGPKILNHLGLVRVIDYMPKCAEHK